jgi:hypothetical protein
LIKINLSIAEKLKLAILKPIKLTAKKESLSTP